MVFNVRLVRFDCLKRESVFWRGFLELLCIYDFCFIKRKIWFFSVVVVIFNYGFKLF